MSDKNIGKPLWADLDRHIFGTFIGYDETEGDAEFVYPKVRPINGFKVLTYKNPVSIKNILELSGASNVDGAQGRVVYCIQGNNHKGLIRSFNKELLEENERLQETVEDLKMRLATLGMEVDDAVSGAANQIKRYQDVKQESSSESEAKKKFLENLGGKL